MAKEFINHESGNDEAWICICGNVPSSDGFYPCDDLGEEVEPRQGVWGGVLYVCDRCGRIINQTTLEVVGRRRLGKARFAIPPRK